MVELDHLVNGITEPMEKSGGISFPYCKNGTCWDNSPVVLSQLAKHPTNEPSVGKVAHESKSKEIS